MQIGIGIIGTGSIVNTYVKCIDELDNARLIALHTKSASRVKEVERAFGVAVYTSIEELVAQPEIQLICVCNESGHHGLAIKAAALAGKHILSEKPLEVTTEKIDEVIAVCKKQKVKLGCVFQNRCSSDYRALEQAVNDGHLGKLLMGNAHINWYREPDYYAKSNWRGTKEIDGGAAFINQGIHTIDLLLNIMGPLQSIFGTIKTMVHDIEGEDVGAATLNFKNGALGAITGGTALYPGYSERLEIYGEKGSILMEAGKITDWNVVGIDPPFDLSSTGSASGASDPTSIGHLNHKMVLADMLQAIKNDSLPMVDGSEARKSVEAITALYRSSEEDKVVYFK